MVAPVGITFFAIIRLITAVEHFLNAVLITFHVWSEKFVFRSCYDEIILFPEKLGMSLQIM